MFPECVLEFVSVVPNVAAASPREPAAFHGIFDGACGTDLIWRYVARRPCNVRLQISGFGGRGGV